MEYTKLGSTELEVSRVGIGCWPIGGPFINLTKPGGWQSANENDARKGLLRALEIGSNCFDTADVYGLGRSERLVGWMIDQLGHSSNLSRSSLCIISKVGYFAGTAPHGFDPLHIQHQLEMSLRNLRTDYLDIYSFHHHDFGQNDEYLDTAIDVMRTLKSKGMIRYIALRGPHKYLRGIFKSKMTYRDHYDRFLDLARKIKPDIIGVRYNLISPRHDEQEYDIFEWAQERGVGVLIYKPLGQGLLLDKYDPRIPPHFESGDHRSLKLWFKSDGLSVLQEALSEVKHRFNCRDVSELAGIAIAYCTRRYASSCTLVGFRNEQQVSECLLSTRTLDDSDCVWLRNLFKDAISNAGAFTINSGKNADD